MNETKRILMNEAVPKLESYLKTGLVGFFAQGWDRLNAAGIDVDLRREPTEANARALLYVANGRN